MGNSELSASVMTATTVVPRFFFWLSRMEYPSDRPRFFANRLIRLLQKSCAANDIGIEACWLVTCIALVEDAKRYSGPVTFWTGQLLPITGFQSWGRLDRARERAVEAGWLHYSGGTNRKCGAYWSMIPEAIANAFDDNPVDEVNHHNSDSQDINHHNGAPNVIETGLKRDRNVIETGLKRDDAVNLPYLSRSPLPVPGHLFAPSLPEEAPEPEIGSGIKITTVGKNAGEKDIPQSKIDEWSEVFPGVNVPAECRKAAQWCRDNPTKRKTASGLTKFLNSWLTRAQESSGRRTALTAIQTSITDEFTGVSDIVKRIWNPDLKNVAQVEAAISNTELFQAAMKTKLSVISDTQNGFDEREVAKVFHRHLEAIRRAKP